MVSLDLIENICQNINLMTFDPYDIWKERLGIKIKKVFYKNKLKGIIPAGLLEFYDLTFGEKIRLGYHKQEYPMVRAISALTLLNLYQKNKTDNYLKYIRQHLQWLRDNYSKGYSGYCWGINFPWISKNGYYHSYVPYVTNTVYVLEAYVKYENISGDKSFDHIIKSIFNFIENDLNIMYEDKSNLALSYSPLNEPRIVINANSYILFMYSLLLPFYKNKENYIIDKIYKIFSFVSSMQDSDGSWYYYADDDPGNFIDCFHSCFIIKNIIKTNKRVKLPNFQNIVENAYKYILKNFYNTRKGLFKRYSINDKPSLIKYDLYDNAEMLNLAYLLNDINLVKKLDISLKENFIIGDNIYSQIDFLGFKHYKNTLRWAVLPYLYSLSETYDL